MNKTQLELILKVFFFSLGLSVIIKYVGPLLSLAPTKSNALVAILLPPLVVLLLLIWRFSNRINPYKTGSS